MSLREGRPVERCLACKADVLGFRFKTALALKARQNRSRDGGSIRKTCVLAKFLGGYPYRPRKRGNAPRVATPISVNLQLAAIHVDARFFGATADLRARP